MGDPTKIDLKAWQWWRAEAGKAHEPILATIKDIILRTSSERRQDLSALRSMYLDLPDVEAYSRDSIGYARHEKSPYLLIQGAIDATRAEITTQRPRPMIVTVGGNGRAQRQAKRMQRWIDGEYERLEVYTKLSQAALDALLFGTGVLKVGSHDKRNTLERVWVGDLWVDPREERFNCVRSMYQIYAVDRDVLADMYPDKTEQIGAIVNPAPRDDAIFPDLRLEGYQSPGLVLVIEAWRLPNSSSSPGKHVILCEGGTLFEEEWKSPKFPFIFYKWADVPMRFFGQGMAERGVGIQSDLNETCGIVRETFDKMVPKIVASKSAGIDESDFTDDPGGVIWVDIPANEAVQVWSPTVSPVTLQHEDRLGNRFYQQLGVSMTRAGAVKPPDLESGVALQNYNDTTASRFTPQAQDYEKASMQTAGLLLENAERIIERDPSAKQRVYGGKHDLKVVEYAEARMTDEDSVYVIRVFPVSGLSNTVSARLDEVRRMQAVRAEAGTPMPPELVDQLVDVPDIQRFRDLQTSGIELVDEAIDACLDGEDVPASEYWPKQYAETRIALAIQKAELEGEDPDGISKLRNLHTMVLEMGMPLEQAPMGPPPIEDPTLAPTPEPGLAPELPVDALPAAE